ncbi:MAG TPA: hypothetical protein VN931_02940 [Fibrobacteria bacterium]|nr:hypothetical protein [Fibrobacteria bacterium]
MNRTLPLASALLVASALRLFLAFEVPTRFETRSGGLSWYNDERAHANYVRHLASDGSFPVQVNSVEVPGAFARGDFEYYQPPLSYLALVPAWRLGEAVRPGQGWLFARLLDALSGAATIFVAWLLVRRIAPGAENWAAWLLALHPGFCYQGVLVSNDPIFWLLGAAFLLVSVEFARGGRAWALAPLAAGLMLSKSSGLTLLPLPLLAAFPPFSADGFRPGKLLRAVLAVGIGLLVAFPWYLRNHHLYGSWMALEVGHGAPGSAFGTLEKIRVLKMLVLYFSTSLWFPMDMDWVVHPVPRTLFALASASWIVPLALRWKRFRDPSTWLPGAAILLGVAAMVPYSLEYVESEARLLFHLLPAFVALWAVAVHPRPARWGALAMAPCLLTWAWVGILFLRKG